MSEPFIGQIMIFAGNFAPRGWALCNGQVLAISQNTALFSILGTFYGGNGTSNFQLPNLQGTVPLHAGSGGGSTYVIGETGGVENVTLLTSTMPQHTHNLQASALEASATDPTNGLFAVGHQAVFSDKTDQTAMLSASVVQPTGGGQPHPNMMPFLAITFVIALQGVFPSRS
jgi:microcystin-dependent protein